MKVQSLRHMVMKVRNQKRAEEFYSGILCFPIVARNEEAKMTFFSFGDYHHHFGIIEIGENATDIGKDSVGLHHAAFKIGDSLEELKEAKEYLALNGIEARTRDHIVTQSLYFNDPDGNPLELYVEGSDKWKTDPKIIGQPGKDFDL
jgi:catechol 2,3-dioxygenase